MAIEKQLEDIAWQVNEVLLGLRTEEAVELVQEGKEDTRWMDWLTEQVIIHNLPSGFSLATEEYGVYPTGTTFSPERSVIFADPIDMSRELERTLRDCPGRSVKEALQSRFRWDTFNSAVTSLTAVQDGQVTANVMLSFDLGRLYVASENGLYTYPIGGEKRGMKVSPATGSYLTTVSLGPRKAHYLDRITQLNWPQTRHVEAGPHRILFLTDQYTSSGPKVEGIFSNGEKITEWIGWLAYSRAANLGVVEFYLKSDNPQLATRESSIFGDDGNLDLSALNKHEKPASYRALMAVMPLDNLKKFTGHLDAQSIDYRVLPTIPP